LADAKPFRGPEAGQSPRLAHESLLGIGYALTAMPGPSNRAPWDWRWAALFAAAGGLALGVQTYLLREYLVTLGGDEAALGLGLGAWLTGIALGALVARRWASRHPRVLAAGAVALLGIAGWAGMGWARFGRVLLGVPNGELIPLGPCLLLAFVVFTLPGAMVGAGFVALGVSAAQASGLPRDAIGKLYVSEALGSLVVGLLVSLVVIPHFAPLAGLGLVLGIGFAAASPAARARLIAGRWLFPALALGAFASALPWVTRPLEASTARARFGSVVEGIQLVDWTDTPYQHVDIGGDESRVLYLDGQYVASFPDPSEDESRAHQLMLLAERPANVLLFGTLDTGMVRFCLQHGVERFDLVQFDRAAFELTRRYLAPADQQALADPRVRVIFADPRRFLAESREPYDLVANLGPDPVTLLHARASTVEFLRLVRARLAPRGVYVTRFVAGANVQAGQVGITGASLRRSLAEVFPVVRAVPEPEARLVAGLSPQAVTLDPTRLLARYRERAIQSEVFSPDLLPSLFPPERVAALESELGRAARSLPPSSDDQPVSFLHALGVRQEIARSAWAPLLVWASNHPVTLALGALGPSLCLALWYVVRRGRHGARAAALHATVVTGAAGMAWSLMLFFSFQTRVGALYSELGALTALFMLGLAAGGAWAVRQSGRPSLMRAQAIAVGGALLVALGFAAVGRAAGGGAMLAILHGLWLVLAGAATGTVFPAAAITLLDRGEQASGAAGLVELADHAGAAVAAVFAAVLFIPALGLFWTAMLLALLELIALGVVMLGQRQ
jgi:spermidine synthase